MLMVEKITYRYHIYENQPKLLIVYSHRKNMSFSNSRLDSIIRDNRILWKKLCFIAIRPPLYYNKTNNISIIPSSYINRKREQHLILSENEVRIIIMYNI